MERGQVLPEPPQQATARGQISRGCVDTVGHPWALSTRRKPGLGVWGVFRGQKRLGPARQEDSSLSDPLESPHARTPGWGMVSQGETAGFGFFLSFYS